MNLILLSNVLSNNKNKNIFKLGYLRNFLIVKNKVFFYKKYKIFKINFKYILYIMKKYIYLNFVYNKFFNKFLIINKKILKFYGTFFENNYYIYILKKIGFIFIKKNIIILNKKNISNNKFINILIYNNLYINIIFNIK